MNKIIKFAVALTLIITTGCASILSKNTYPVSINSNPSGARLTITDSKGQLIGSGTTPYLATLSASSGPYSSGRYTLTFEKNGTTTRSEINATLDGWYIGNILFGGLIGILIVDPLTGSMWKLPSTHVVNLSGSTSLSPTDLNILDIAQLDENQRKALIPVR